MSLVGKGQREGGRGRTVHGILHPMSVRAYVPRTQNEIPSKLRDRSVSSSHSIDRLLQSFLQWATPTTASINLLILVEAR